MHISGQKHVTGQAPYCDDIRKDGQQSYLPHIKHTTASLFVPDALHLAFVLSTKASAKLLSVDPSDALTMDGVVAFVDHNDIPGKKLFGIVLQDTPVFSEKEVLVKNCTT